MDKISYDKTSRSFQIESCHYCRWFQWYSISQQANCLKKPGVYFDPQLGFPEFCCLKKHGECLPKGALEDVISGLEKEVNLIVDRVDKICSLNPGKGKDFFRKINNYSRRIDELSCAINILYRVLGSYNC